MSKVLIDRALLERVQERLDPHRDAVLWGAVCDTFRSAPSGTPARPVRAYYHEAPNEYGGFNKSVGLEVRKAFIDAPLVLEADALTQIACLEGETAKRDARIAELEARYQRDVYGLNNEGDPIGGEPAGGYANDNARLRAELAAIKAQEPVAWAGAIEYGVPLLMVEPQNWKATPLYAAPVSEAKAQGVVMPEGWIPLTIEHEPGYPEDVAFGPKRMMDRLKRWLDRYFEMRLNDAPAAPAADAGLVEALKLAANRLDRLALEQGEFWRGYATAWADEARATANGVRS